MEPQTRVRDDTSGQHVDEAVASPQTWLLVHYGTGVLTFPIEDGQTLIVGRTQPCDVALDDPTLSRRHASIERVGDEVWLEDLASFNGTEVNGMPLLGRGCVNPGDEVRLGEVALWVHRRAPLRSAVEGFDSHDDFVKLLRDEALRTRVFGRSLALLLVGATGPTDLFVGHTCPRLRQLVQPVDKLALYSPTIAEVLLIETERDAALRVADEIVRMRGRDEPTLLCSVAMFPGAAGSAEELLDVARSALRLAKPSVAVVAAKLRDTPSIIPRANDGNAGRESQAPIVHSSNMHEVFRLAERFASIDAPILIQGETGVGKEVIAHAIHARSERSGRPLVCINCSAIPEQLIESTFFGHERGAFTGAHQQRQGVFEAAHRGTLLLDEVGELSPSAQASLLRAIETKRIVRVGSTKEIPVDVRVLAATNRDLENMCEDRTFRLDLYYRLNGLRLHIPPLRERREDIRGLAQHFLELAQARSNPARSTAISADALEALANYGWPGNVRELRNEIEHATINARGVIGLHHLNARVRDAFPRMPNPEDDGRERSSRASRDAAARSFKERVQEFERSLIVESLQATGWNQSTTARELRIPIRTLSYKMRTLRIRPPDD